MFSYLKCVVHIEMCFVIVLCLSFLESFNQIHTQRKQPQMFFLILSFCFARFPFVFNLFFLLYFHAVFFPALYNNLYTKTTLNLVTLVSHSQETEDKKTVCICFKG